MLLLLLALLPGCLSRQTGTPRGPGARVAALVAGPPLSLDAVWLLERGGTSEVTDTSVTLSRHQGRRILLRYPAPDYGLLLLLELPADSTAPPTDSLRVRLTPVPGLYSVVIEASGPLPAETALSFSYARHFGQPAGALATYPTARRFEEMLVLVHHEDEDRLVPLAPQRPASDVLRALLPGPGRFTLIAPKRLPS